MKKIIVLLFILNSIFVKAQNDCSTAYQYCGNNITLPLVTDVPDAGMANCLMSTPNIGWFFFQVDQGNNGVLNLQVNGFDQSLTSGLDIDLAVMGPFSSIDCANITDSLNNNPFPFCDYSTSSNITVSVNNIQSGEYYMIMITNFSNLPAYAQFIEQGSTFSYVQTNCISNVDDLNDEDDFYIANPFSEILIIDNLPSDQYIFTVYDLNGKIVLSKSDSHSHLELNLNGLPDGLYVTELNYKGKIRKKKVIKAD